jgi:outer membrane assembly lipoprotein YfgL
MAWAGRALARRLSGAVAVLAGAVLLAGCAAERPQPTPLEVVKPRIAGRVVWQLKLGSAIGFPLVATVRDGHFFVGADDGTVLAVETVTGRVRWRVQAGDRLSAGVGSDGRHMAVVTQGQELVVFEGERLAWRTRVPGRVVTAPLVAGERVFVLGLDRSVRAYDVRDGRALWQLARPSDALTLGQSGVLMPFGNLLLAGQGPRLAAIEPLRGQVRWEAPLAAPRGTNEIERLADLVGPAVRIGSSVCARAFQASVGCVDAARGQPVWRRTFGGTQAVGADDTVLVAADASDRVSAWRHADGSLLWTSDRLLHRDLAGVAVVGAAAVVVDFAGEVHFLDKMDGQPLLRLATDASAPVGQPVADGTTLLVAKRSGTLFAFRPE